MKREIKFRAWTGDTMIYEGWNGNSFTTKEVIFRYDNVMQFTGLKDCNGIDIYEGDILKMWILPGDDERGISPYLNIVEYYFGALGYRDYDGEFHSFADHSYISKPQITDAVILGNIYEHPHLLNRTPKHEVSDTTEAK